MSVAKRSSKSKPRGLWNSGILKKVSASLPQERTELQLCGRMRQLRGKGLSMNWRSGHGRKRSALISPQ